ncbi:aldose 1-epimerase family protein [Yokenella regensburgei]|uniref:aldose epimerase family protein n=1 Tax=Yokenella regensburgei TaxID=158877 RepID=UPI003F15F8FD
MACWTLENDAWRIRVAARGAELCEWWDKTHQRSPLWQPDPRVWNNSATQLFPVVGRLRHNGLWHQDAFWPLPAHGFLRHQPFSLEHIGPDTLQLKCDANDETRKMWPFDWTLRVGWTLTPQGITVNWSIENHDARAFPFALGWHPGFALTVATQAGWQIRFSSPVGGPYPTQDRTLSIPDESPCTSAFSLGPDTFQQGAVYFAMQEAKDISVVSPDGVVALRMNAPEARWLALWGVPGADLLCIEPLTGTTDDPTFDGNVIHKRGMRWLAPGERYRQSVGVILAQDVA